VHGKNQPEIYMDKKMIQKMYGHAAFKDEIEFHESRSKKGKRKHCTIETGR